MLVQERAGRGLVERLTRSEGDEGSEVEVAPFELPQLAGAAQIRVDDAGVCAVLPGEVKCWRSGLTSGATLPIEVSFE